MVVPGIIYLLHGLEKTGCVVSIQMSQAKQPLSPLPPPLSSFPPFALFRPRVLRPAPPLRPPRSKKKIAVVSAAGPYRTGKSYFLNYFANHVLALGSDPPRVPGSFDFERPFQTSPTVNVDSDDASGRVHCHLLPACANPLPGHSDTALLLLDTPGLMAPRR